MNDKDVEPWLGVGAGAGLIIGILRELYFQASSQSFSIGDLIVFGIIGAFCGAILAAVLFGVIFSTLNTVSKIDNPFAKGLALVLVPLLVLAGADLLLLGGNYVLEPVISFLSDGTVERTIYSCENWVPEHNGYCAD
ncbi:hypothetical protein [Celeribacter marinus]|uniref:hypothetical protein n=1 Tax=Celeribacter marinus TaxID=1397108 RepID=UPI00317B7E66